MVPHWQETFILKNKLEVWTCELGVEAGLWTLV
jgi:hypothetical protein